MPSEAIDKLIAEGCLWRGRVADQSKQRLEPTGWRVLDECIGGWPKSGICELLSPGRQGLSLVLPLLAQLSQGERWLAWVGPPYLPFTPALVAAGVKLERMLLVQEKEGTQCLWASEQLLRSTSCALVLAWPERLRTTQLRRLQLAAEEGGGTGLLFRPLGAASQPSYAALRLRITPSPIGLDVTVLKRPGGWSGQHCTVLL